MSLREKASSFIKRSPKFRPIKHCLDGVFVSFPFKEIGLHNFALIPGISGSSIDKIIGFHDTMTDAINKSDGAKVELKDIFPLSTTKGSRRSLASDVDVLVTI